MQRLLTAVVLACAFAAGPATAQSLPDLGLVDVRFLANGIGVAIRNNGGAPSGATTVAIYVDGAVKTETPLAAIQPGMMTIMALESPGPNTRFQVVLDSRQQVAESDEDNNRSDLLKTPRK